MPPIPINKQIMAYVRQQQALIRQQTDIKKADPIRQDKKSACISNQSTQGVNQYEPV